MLINFLVSKADSRWITRLTRASWHQNTSAITEIKKYNLAETFGVKPTKITVRALSAAYNVYGPSSWNGSYATGETSLRLYDKDNNEIAFYDCPGKKGTYGDEVNDTTTHSYTIDIPPEAEFIEAYSYSKYYSSSSVMTITTGLFVKSIEVDDDLIITNNPVEYCYDYVLNYTAEKNISASKLYIHGQDRDHPYQDNQYDYANLVATIDGTPVDISSKFELLAGQTLTIKRASDSPIMSYHYAIFEEIPSGFNNLPLQENILFTGDELPGDVTLAITEEADITTGGNPIFGIKEDVRRFPACILDFETEIPLNVPPTVDVSQLYKGFEYDSNLKCIRNKTIGHNGTVNSYIKFEAKAGDKVSLKAKNESELNYDYAYAHVTTTATAPTISNTTDMFCDSKGSNTWKEYTYTIPSDGTYYLHLGYRKDSSGTTSPDKGYFDDIKIIRELDFGGFDNSLSLITEVDDTVVAEHGFKQFKIKEDVRRKKECEDYTFTGAEREPADLPANIDTSRIESFYTSGGIYVQENPTVYQAIIIYDAPESHVLKMDVMYFYAGGGTANFYHYNENGNSEYIGSIDTKDAYSKWVTKSINLPYAGKYELRFYGTRGSKGAAFANITFKYRMIEEHNETSLFALVENIIAGAEGHSSIDLLEKAIDTTPGDASLSQLEIIQVKDFGALNSIEKICHTSTAVLNLIENICAGKATKLNLIDRVYGTNSESLPVQETIQALEKNNLALAEGVTSTALNNLSLTEVVKRDGSVPLSIKEDIRRTPAILDDYVYDFKLMNPPDLPHNISFEHTFSEATLVPTEKILLEAEGHRAIKKLSIDVETITEDDTAEIDLSVELIKPTTSLVYVYAYVDDVLQHKYISNTARKATIFSLGSAGKHTIMIKAVSAPDKGLARVTIYGLKLPTYAKDSEGSTSLTLSEAIEVNPDDAKSHVLLPIQEKAIIGFMDNAYLSILEDVRHNSLIYTYNCSSTKPSDLPNTIEISGLFRHGYIENNHVVFVAVGKNILYGDVSFKTFLPNEKFILDSTVIKTPSDIYGGAILKLDGESINDSGAYTIAKPGTHVFTCEVQCGVDYGSIIYKINSIGMPYLPGIEEVALLSMKEKIDFTGSESDSYKLLALKEKAYEAVDKAFKIKEKIALEGNKTLPVKEKAVFGSNAKITLFDYIQAAGDASIRLREYLGSSSLAHLTIKEIIKIAQSNTLAIQERIAAHVMNPLLLKEQIYGANGSELALKELIYVKWSNGLVIKEKLVQSTLRALNLIEDITSKNDFSVLDFIERLQATNLNDLALKERVILANGSALKLAEFIESLKGSALVDLNESILQQSRLDLSLIENIYGTQIKELLLQEILQQTAANTLCVLEKIENPNLALIETIINDGYKTRLLSSNKSIILINRKGQPLC